MERYLAVGCFPQLRLSDYMPRQKMLFLPTMTEADKITVISKISLKNNLRGDYMTPYEALLEYAVNEGIKVVDFELGERMKGLYCDGYIFK